MFCITIVCVINICTFIFDSKERTHAEINLQNFVTQKKLMQNFLSQKNASKNKSPKIFDSLVRVHNNKRLELCRHEGTSKVYNWNFKTKASGCTAAYSKVLARL